MQFRPAFQRLRGAGGTGLFINDRRYYNVAFLLLVFGAFVGYIIS